MKAVNYRFLYCHDANDLIHKVQYSAQNTAVLLFPVQSQSWGRLQCYLILCGCERQWWRYTSSSSGVKWERLQFRGFWLKLVSVSHCLSDLHNRPRSLGATFMTLWLGVNRNLLTIFLIKSHSDNHRTPSYLAAGQLKNTVQLTQHLNRVRITTAQWNLAEFNFSLGS